MLLLACTCRESEEVPLTKRLRLHCQKRLSEAGTQRDIAGVLLGRLLMRSDCHVSMHQFVSWAGIQLQCAEPMAAFPVAAFLVPGNRQAAPQISLRAVMQSRAVRALAGDSQLSTSAFPVIYLHHAVQLARMRRTKRTCPLKSL